MTQKTRMVLLITTLASILLLIAYWLYLNLYLPNQRTSVDLAFLTHQPIEAQHAYHFTFTNQSSPQLGVYTNYKETAHGSEMSTGHEILSESIGLTMEYAVLANAPELFDAQFKLMQKNFITKDGLIKWRVHASKNRTSETSALVDDLRIYKTLMVAYQNWGIPAYKTTADSLLQGITLYETNFPNVSLLSYYDAHQKLSEESIPIFYLDLKAMAIAADNDSRWNDFFSESITILENARISKTFPLYKKSYQYATRSYDQSSTINIIEGLLPALYLSEMKGDTSTVESWMARTLETGGIKTVYDVNGTPQSEDESTAAYAIGAQIAFNANNHVLYKALIERMNHFQIRDKSSELFGAYGNQSTLQSYSFDNLQALIALVK